MYGSLLCGCACHESDTGKSQQDAKKEKGWSGSQMPSWVFLFIGAFIR